jgi:hypothetical protein
MKSFKQIYSMLRMNESENNEREAILDEISNHIARGVVQDFIDKGHMADIRDEHEEQSQDSAESD